MSPRTPLLVGLVLVVATFSLSWFLLTTSKDKFGEEATYYLYADFSDASGIRWKTRVQINGIDVGKIEEIKHVRGTTGALVARVKLRILNDYEVYEDALLRKVAESLLGDFRLDMLPGSPAKRKLEQGDVIANVRSLSDFDEIQSQLKQVAINVNEVTENFKRVLAGPEGEGSMRAIFSRVERSMEAIEKATAMLSETMTRNEGNIDRVLTNVGAFSESLAKAGGPDGDLTQLTDNLARLSARLTKIANSVQDMVSGEGGEWEQGASLRRSIENLNESLNHINGIAKKIDDGQGTLGHIVNDSAIADKVEQTLDDASELIGGLSKLQTEVELRSEYAVPIDAPVPGRPSPDDVRGIKNTLGVRIMPKPDKYYIIEAVADPRGKQIVTKTTTTIGTSTTAVDKTTTTQNELKFSAQFAKRYYFLTLRFGIIENTGGLGANVHALRDDLELRLDAFDFSRRNPNNNTQIFPRLRSYAMYQFVNHLYLQAGMDDPFNRFYRAWFAGGVLRFNDDDLKSLLSVAPKP
ncbi:MAG: MCE family protein [Deltaproteobacteria bacterium]|nr:MCE family protein [Deltaproteobacteria bacterium]